MQNRSNNWSGNSVKTHKVLPNFLLRYSLKVLQCVQMQLHAQLGTKLSVSSSKLGPSY